MTVLEKICALLERANTLYIPLIIFICADYLTGVCVAIKMRQLSSKIGFSGILRKVLIFLITFLGKIIDQYVLPSGSPTECAIILFYLSNEGISILENLKKLGVPIPNVLSRTINTLSEETPSDQSPKKTSFKK